VDQKALVTLGQFAERKTAVDIGRERWSCHDGVNPALELKGSSASSNAAKPRWIQNLRPLAAQISAAR